MTTDEKIERDPVLWVRVGDAGEYTSFDDIEDALDYLNELRVGCVSYWRTTGFDTPNYHGFDGIIIYWGDSNRQFVRYISTEERLNLITRLEENYL